MFIPLLPMTTFPQFSLVCPIFAFLLALQLGEEVLQLAWSARQRD